MSNIFTETPADPVVAAKVRMMRRVVIFLGALLVIGLAVLIAGFIIKGYHSGEHTQKTVPMDTSSDTGTHAAAIPGKPVSMSLAPGFQILSADTQPGRLILHVRSPKRDEIDIIDLKDGRIISRIHSADENSTGATADK